jgi:hypothetical protein
MTGGGGRDLYLILGVAPGADQRAIDSAYRRLCRRHHPDVCRDPDAGARMREINAAYFVLRDPERRRGYDRRAAPAQPTAVRWEAARRAWRTAASGPHGVGRPPTDHRAPTVAPSARLRVTPGGVDFGFVRAGETATRTVLVQGLAGAGSPGGGAFHARVFTRGDWLRVDPSELGGAEVLLRVTADPRELSAFWQAPGAESARLEGSIELVDRHGSLRVPISAILRREPRGRWSPFGRRAG